MPVLFDYTGQAYSDDTYVIYNTSIAALQFTTAGAINASAYKIKIDSLESGYTGTLTGELYTDNAGSLGSLVAGSGASVAVGAGGVFTVTPSSPVALAAGTTYWLKWTASNNLYCYNKADNDSGTHRVTYAGNYLNNASLEYALEYAAAGPSIPVLLVTAGEY